MGFHGAFYFMLSSMVLSRCFELSRGFHDALSTLYVLSLAVRPRLRLRPWRLVLSYGAFVGFFHGLSWCYHGAFMVLSWCFLFHAFMGAFMVF